MPHRKRHFHDEAHLIKNASSPHGSMLRTLSSLRTAVRPHMLSVMLWMAFAGILVSASSPLILNITKVLEGMVAVAFRDLPSQPWDPRLYNLTVTCGGGGENRKCRWVRSPSGCCWILLGSWPWLWPWLWPSDLRWETNRHLWLSIMTSTCTSCCFFCRELVWYKHILVTYYHWLCK